MKNHAKGGSFVLAIALLWYGLDSSTTTTLSRGILQVHAFVVVTKSKNNNNNNNRIRRRDGFLIDTTQLFQTPSSSPSQPKRSKPRRKTKTKRTQQKKGRPRSRILRSTTSTSDRGRSVASSTLRRQRRPLSPSIRPLLTHYKANRNERTNQARLQGSIGCQHFGKCSGCVVDQNVALVDRVQAAKRYFSSTAVRRKRADVLAQEDDDDEADFVPITAVDEDDGFFELVVPTELKGWRTQAKLVVAPKSSRWRAGDGCQFGLYLRKTHQVLSIPNCAVHHPSINRAVELLEKATAKVGTPAFVEETREGGLRYVQLQVDRSSGTVCLSLVWNAENLKETHPALTLLKNELIKLDKDLWHSIWCHCNDGLGNNIFHRSPKRWHRLTGHEFIREPFPLGDHGFFYFSPLTFRQGNMDGFDILALDVADAVPGGSKVCELYAGVGVLGLTALVHHHQNGEPLQWLRCSDVNPANPRSFSRAVESLPIDVTHFSGASCGGGSNDEMTMADFAKMMQSGEDVSSSSPLVAGDEGPKTTYVATTATNAVFSGQALGANVLIVDPPRRGLDDEVLTELCKPFDPTQPYVESPTLLSMPREKIKFCNDINKLIYVSCGFDALARDAEKLLKSSGGWVLEKATGYLLFPGSDHVETVCIFTRK